MPTCKRAKAWVWPCPPHTLELAERLQLKHVQKAQGKLRKMHLRYHWAMMDVLSPKQVPTHQKLHGD